MRDRPVFPGASPRGCSSHGDGFVLLALVPSAPVCVAREEAAAELDIRQNPGLQASPAQSYLALPLTDGCPWPLPGSKHLEGSPWSTDEETEAEEVKGGFEPSFSATKSPCLTWQLLASFSPSIKWT